VYRVLEVKILEFLTSILEAMNGELQAPVALPPTKEFQMPVD
jgi:hypothetical protein